MNLERKEKWRSWTAQECEKEKARMRSEAKRRDETRESRHAKRNTKMARKE